MQSATDLFDEALRIGASELDALIAGNVDQAEELCNKRNDLIERSLALQGENLAPLRSRLLAMRELQQRLIAQGENLREQIKKGLVQSKKQSQRMKGYGTAIKQALANPENNKPMQV